MLFSEYCKLRGINQNGYHLRRLSNLNSDFKEDVSPLGTQTTWAVKIDECDKIFGGE